MPIINTLAPPISRRGAKIYSQDALGNAGWMYADIDEYALYIGVPGSVGFGVGVCPPDILPPGFTPLSGYADVNSPNYGNYQYSDGSIMVWVPKFYYRINHNMNPTYPIYTPNDIDIKGVDVFTNRTLAESSGYALHRAFIDGGIEHDGFFVDKFMCSSNTKGTGFIASSIKNGLPLSADASHNPVGGLTSVAGINILASFVTAAKARDGENGLINSNSMFFCQSIFINSALAMLSLAHGQSSNGTANCAWWSSTTTNFPKGNNNNALKDSNDVTVIYQSDGFSNCGKTGSGSLFSKTTHNGQNCGVADLNGNLWEALIGITSIVTSKNITGATRSNPCVITVNNHGYSTNRIIQINSILGMTQLNDKLYTITVIDINTFSLNGVDSTLYTPYTSGGSVSVGEYYISKESTSVKTFTSGNTLATDHWGVTGVGILMELIEIPHLAASGGTSSSLLFGNGVNQVLSSNISGNEYKLSGCGLPKSSLGISSGGTDLFGRDFFSQYFRDQCCVLGCGRWLSGSNAGVWGRHFIYARNTSSNYVGFRLACYPLV